MEILGIDVWYLAGAGAAWITLTLLFWEFYAKPMFKKWVKSTILLMVTEPDKDTELAINSLFTLGWNWFLKPVETGRIVKSKGDDGEETETKEAISPYNQLINESARIMFMKLKGQAGGSQAKLAAELSGLAEGNPLGLSPAAMKALLKGQFGPAIAEVGLPRLMEFINKRKADTSSSGGAW